MSGWRNMVTWKQGIVLGLVVLCGLPVTTRCVARERMQPDGPVDSSRQPLLALAEVRQTAGGPAAPLGARNARTPDERRLEFERKYGIEQPSRYWFLRLLQSAKYGIDKASFTAKETANRLQFTYDFGTPTGSDGMTRESQYSLPVFGHFGHPQLKTVLTEHDPQTGSPFIGIKVAVPFGEGD